MNVPADTDHVFQELALPHVDGVLSARADHEEFQHRRAVHVSNRVEPKAAFRLECVARYSFRLLKFSQQAVATSDGLRPPALGHSRDRLVAGAS